MFCLECFEVGAVTMFPGKDIHVDTILYAKEDVLVFDLSFGIER